MYLSEIEKNIIISYLKDNLHPKFIYLFGSFANRLSFQVKRDIQIVNIKDIDTVFAAQIVGNREELYCEDAVLMANYNIRVFKDYAKLNEERKCILNTIERDGSIYG